VSKIHDTGFKILDSRFRGNDRGEAGMTEEKQVGEDGGRRTRNVSNNATATGYRLPKMNRGG